MTNHEETQTTPTTTDKPRSAWPILITIVLCLAVLAIVLINQRHQASCSANSYVNSVAGATVTEGC
jgi:hypothetical protein